MVLEEARGVACPVRLGLARPLAARAVPPRGLA
jgi:hypothetical protein